MPARVIENWSMPFIDIGNLHFEDAVKAVVAKYELKHSQALYAVLEDLDGLIIREPDDKVHPWPRSKRRNVAKASAIALREHAAAALRHLEVMHEAAEQFREATGDDNPSASILETFLGPIPDNAFDAPCDYHVLRSFTMKSADQWDPIMGRLEDLSRVDLIDEDTSGKLADVQLRKALRKCFMYLRAEEITRGNAALRKKDIARWNNPKMLRSKGECLVVDLFRLAGMELDFVKINGGWGAAQAWLKENTSATVIP